MKKITKDLFVVLLIFMIYLINCESQQDVEKEVKSIIEKAVEKKVRSMLNCVSISAKDLCRVYKENEVAADINYKYKIFYIYGTVENVGKDRRDRVYVILEGNGWTGIQCFFSNAHINKIVLLRKGQLVKIKGRCEGLALFNIDIVFKGCIFE